MCRDVAGTMRAGAHLGHGAKVPDQQQALGRSSVFNPGQGNPSPFDKV